MKLNAKRTFLSISAIILLVLAGYWGFSRYSTPLTAGSSGETSLEEQRETYAGEEEYEKGEEYEEKEREERLERIKAKKQRSEYYFRLLRDPAINAIPPNIRAREINHAKQIPTFEQVKRNVRSKGNTISVAEGYNWQLAGPPAVGGRTRALAIDQTNSDVIIAGGVSGGIWKSTDGGNTWDLKTAGLENFSVTSLAQDPTAPSTWYYTSGEYIGSTADAPGAPYYGTGIFKSTDNGETWSKIPGTSDENSQFDSPYDFINRVKVSPTTGTVFTANNAFGIYRSPDGNDFSNLTLGGRGEHAYADVDVATDGTVVAVLSSVSAGVSGGDPGVYASTDDGQTWTEITPGTFPADHGRSVITTAPSDPNIIYVLTDKTQDDTNQGVSFHMIDISNGLNNFTAEDRSANLPDFGDPVGGFNLQSGYNMTIAVKPDDPDFVTMGGTNLFRSYDGFATAPSGNTASEKDKYWIGGYDQANDVSQYPDQHADQHVQVYDPSNSNRMWVGHDGGLSVTNDITAEPVDWIDRNEGYIVTQFYDISIGLGQDDPRIMGGTQDNGTPLFELNNQLGTMSQDVSSGDGGYSFFTENFLYVSTQRQASTGNNRVVRLSRDNSTSPTVVTPQQATTAFFINPYAVDPNDEGIMYYPGGDSLFRNTNVDQGTRSEQNWEMMSAAELDNHNISALAVSTSPGNILYYAGSNNTEVPVIKRLDNASVSNSEPVDISISQAAAGSFVHDIAINPLNANDVLVVMSNYGVVGLYHTSNGGSTWEAVEGNLAGSSDRSSTDAGPSMRTATIIPSESGPIYFLGTSTGLYATQSLNGDQTQWGRESATDSDGNPDIGFSVVENITSRFSDGDVAVGTHGRGAFVGDFQGQVAASDFPLISLNPTEGRAGDEVTITATNFQFSTNPDDNNVLFGPIPAKVTQATSNQLTVVVPRGTLPPMSDNQTIFVSVDNPNGTNPQDVPFKILDPQTFTVEQNYPNPFRASTTIPFDLPADAEVTISVYNMSGQQVLQPLKQASYNAGTYNEEINLSQLASGVYIYRIYVKASSGGDDAMQSKKMTLIK